MIIGRFSRSLYVGSKIEYLFFIVIFSLSKMQEHLLLLKLTGMLLKYGTNAMTHTKKKDKMNDCVVIELSNIPLQSEI